MSILPWIGVREGARNLGRASGGLAILFLGGLDAVRLESNEERHF